MNRVNKSYVKKDSPMVKQIDGSTHIIFTMKNFFALISAILGLFFGFYMLVVEPRIKETEKHYDIMYNEQKELNKVFTDEIVAIKLKVNITSDNLLLKNPTANTNITSTGATKPIPVEIRSDDNDADILANITRFR